MENRMERCGKSACNVKSVRWRQPDIMWCLVPARPMRRLFLLERVRAKTRTFRENPL